MKSYMSIVITKEELSTYAGQGVITDANRAEQVVDAINEYIQRATGRVWGEVQSGTETHDFASVIFLKNMDVVTVTAIERDGTALATTSYRWRDTGRVVLSSYEARFRTGYDEIEVTYTYGNPIVPEDLKQAALSLALDTYNYVDEGQQREVTAEAIGSLRYSYASGSSSSVGKMHLATISSYRRIGA